MVTKPKPLVSAGEPVYDGSTNDSAPSIFIKPPFTIAASAAVTPAKAVRQNT